MNILSGYLDARKEIIQGSARVYFTSYLTRRGLEPFQYDIEFEGKMEGLSCGCACILKLPTSMERFFVKTYQDGPTSSGGSSKRPPNAREILVYKFLESIGIGGEAHFIVGTDGSTRSLYIGTKEVDYVNLSKLSDDTDIRPLIIIDYLVRVLRITDVGSNASNCGVDAFGRPVIIDFKIEEAGSFVISDSELIDYFAGRCGRSWIDTGYHHHMKRSVQAEKEVKLTAIRGYQTNLDGDLGTLLDVSLAFTKEFCAKWQGKLDLCVDRIDDYVNAMKHNIEKFQSFG